MLDLTVEAFRSLVAAAGQRRAYLVYSGTTGTLVPSHPSLEALAASVAEEHDFAEHEGMFFEIGRGTGTLHSAFVHKTMRGQAAGGVRHWPYATLRDLVRDGLRLSRGMGRKNALAGLWWGGGKGVIARERDDRYEDPGYRGVLYEEYG